MTGLCCSRPSAIVLYLLKFRCVKVHQTQTRPAPMVGLIILEADACSIIVQLTRRMRPSIQNYLKIFFYAKFSASQVNALVQALLKEFVSN